ncbi:hypothetical protein, partial [Amycolatopsis thailandensis]|uniref:hypothetical protein n=1 Tax=Amycolatopsis thailandensis TaxID=589330 RepID=UPI001ABF3562
MVRAGRPEARVVPVFLVVPAARVVLAGPVDRRVLVAPVLEDPVGPRGPADLVGQEAPVGQAAPAVLRPVAPVRSPAPPPLRRHG